MKFYCFFEIGEEPEKIKKTLKMRKEIINNKRETESVMCKNQLNESVEG